MRTDEELTEKEKNALLKRIKTELDNFDSFCNKIEISGELKGEKSIHRVSFEFCIDREYGEYLE